ncbi:MAG: VanZ family protein [Clostridiales bacterium]|nr:VanZ family protein [Clostridiales bacterium]MDY3746072.1 VanZ family protein [Lachnospiraceae bacterium]
MNYKNIKIVSAVFLVLYMSALAYVCFFSETYGRTQISSGYHYNFVPFKEIRRFLEYREVIGFKAVLLNLFGNVFVFSPFGFIVPVISRKSRVVMKMLILTFMLSFCIETIQLLCRVGSFDVDDLLLNTLGGLIGYAVFKILDVIRKKNEL